MDAGALTGRADVKNLVLDPPDRVSLVQRLETAIRYGLPESRGPHEAATPTAVMPRLRGRERPLKHPGKGERKEGTNNPLYPGLLGKRITILDESSEPL